MIKNMVHFEVKTGERTYNFLCSPDSPLGEIYDALHQMKREVIHKINELNSDQKEVKDSNAD